ncbi:MAG: UvrD-helicase domain-containing protein [Deltaproteobacteria bacterium]|jgi:ATP-dependent helicase/nuclease subunit A|nr:UvrD-helicase domain-containing protein [Deltaproteobacteria bacterium]
MDPGQGVLGKEGDALKSPKNGDFDESQEIVLGAWSNLCVNAGAGSGKTKTLVECLLRFVEADPAARSVSQILAITFTEKAAAEAKERLCLAIWARLRRAVEKKDERARSLWEREIRLLSQGYVGTIHGYALSLVRDFHFFLGLPASFRVEPEPDQDETVEFVVDALVRRDPHVFSLLGQFPLRGYSKFQASVQSLLDLIKARLSGWGLEGLTLLSSPKPSLNELAEAFKARQAALKMAIMANSVHKLNTAVIDFAVDETLLGLVAAVQKNPQSLSNILGGALEPLVSLAKKVDKYTGKSLPAELKLACAAAFEIFRLFSDLISQPILRDLAEISKTLAERTRKSRLSRGKGDFDDILILARRLLRERAEVREREMAKWGLVVVDEFQDTNRLQTDLLSLILDPKGRALAWESMDWQAIPPKFRACGDKNQSMYRFRGAEARIMADLSGRLPAQGGEGLNLGHNYRSQTGLVNFFNKLFQKVFGQSVYPKQTPKRVDLYQIPKVAWLKDENFKRSDLRVWKERQAEILTAYLGQLFSGEAKVLVLDREKAKELEAEKNNSGDEGSEKWLEREALLGRTPVPGDVAILLRARKYAYLYEGALAEAGYPYRALEGLSYADRPEIQGLCAFFFALCGWGFDFNLYASLKSPLGPVSHETLSTLVWPDPHGEPMGLSSYFKPSRPPFPGGLPLGEATALEEFRELFLALSPLAAKRPPGEILETVVERRGLLPILASRLGDGPERVQMTQRFLGIVKGLPYHDSVQAKIPALALALRLKLERNKLSDLESQADPTAINLMTIHQAKGLEFPVVIVPEADRQLSNRTAIVLIDDDGSLSISCKTLTGLLAENWERQEVEEISQVAELDELKRLLYVAATRARDHLALIGIDKIDKPSFSSLIFSPPPLKAESEEPKAAAKSPSRAKKGQSETAEGEANLDFKDLGQDILTLKDWPDSLTLKESREESKRKARAGAGGAAVAADLADSDFDPRLLAPPPPAKALHSSVVAYCRLLVNGAKGLGRPLSGPPILDDDFLDEASLAKNVLSEDERVIVEEDGYGQVGPDGPTSPRLRGILFHALLEETDYGWDEGVYRARLETIAKRLNMAPSGVEATYLVERALAFQASPFGQEAQAADRDGRILWREKSFWLRIDEDELGYSPVVLNGIMDLFYVLPDDRGRVVDYKLARPSHLDVYRKQLEIYSLAIREAGFEAEVLTDLWFAEK